MHVKPSRCYQTKDNAFGRDKNGNITILNTRQQTYELPSIANASKSDSSPPQDQHLVRLSLYRDTVMFQCGAGSFNTSRLVVVMISERFLLSIVSFHHKSLTF
eukprot:TRINITY_DN41586_c0_g1_i1.p1 TRINITY_DN41586_c0_g1~~TRINITY_DN41586_c0_g1_i1.p1  ORF type:complete len:103 (-),score=11.98 TRINITY_DN41586_c0_g1_i1:119-427(-)